MKKILTNFFIFYIGVGSLVVLPMSFSYIYAEWFVMINLGWSIFSFNGLVALFTMGFLIAIMPMIRALLWLPSLIMWFMEPKGPILFDVVGTRFFYRINEKTNFYTFSWFILVC
jgi:hypothetical protein